MEKEKALDNNGAARWPGVFWVPMRRKMGKQGPRERASDRARRCQGHGASWKMDPCARLCGRGRMEDTVEEERERARKKWREKEKKMRARARTDLKIGFDTDPAMWPDDDRGMGNVD